MKVNVPGQISYILYYVLVIYVLLFFVLQDIVDQLVENSATFKEKTEFAQQKYIKKKKKK